MLLDLCLQSRPLIAQTGLSLHGYRRRERFILHGLWGLHVYLYNGEIQIGEQVFAFRDGSISLTPPDTAVEWHFPDHAPHYYVHFRLDDCTGADAPAVGIPLITHYDRDFETLIEEMDELSRLHPLQPLRSEVLLWEILWRLAGQDSRQVKSNDGDRLPPAVQIATSLIENALGEQLLVHALAHRVGVSHNHLTNLFRRSYGTTVVEYIRRRRCRRALHLLTNTSLSLTSIAREVGVPDLQHFNKMIRRELGCAPSRLRATRQLQ